MPELPCSVKFRSDEPAATHVLERVRQASVSFRQEFILMVAKMEQDKIPRQECMETLSGRFETYALLLGGFTEFLLCVRDQNSWTILQITDHLDLKQEAYREVCKAHGLVNPTRS